MSGRGVAPVVGISLLVAVTVVLAAVVGAFAIGVGGQADDASQAAISAKTGSNPNEIFLTHQGGDVLDVSKLTMRVFVDGRPLEHQPACRFLVKQVSYMERKDRFDRTTTTTGRPAR